MERWHFRANKAIVLGDSIVKHPSGYHLSHFSYHLLIHAGTNNILTNKQPEQIVKLIVQLALSDITDGKDIHQRSCSDKPALEGIMQRKDIFWYSTIRQSQPDI